MIKNSIRMIYLTIICIISLCIQPVFAQSDTNETDRQLQYIKHFENKVQIIHKYSEGYDMWLDFERGGVNSILGIGNIYLAPNDQSTIRTSLSKTAKILSLSCTDWTSPYVVKDMAKPNKTPNFTGGWHGYNGDGTGRPTARTAQYEVVADGEPLQANKEKFCETAEIKVVNLIEGYNTKDLPENEKYVLKETVHYLIVNGQINIDVEIEALKDIAIERYYGIQTVNYGWRDIVAYADSSVYQGQLSSDSGAIKDMPNIDSITIKNTKDGHYLKAWINKSYDLGSQQYVNSSLPGVFTESYGKSYFNIVNGSTLMMKTGDKHYLRGGYLLKKSN
ncbi:hypothetical protein [Petroclostridium sp. X23]|uniref:hypothetical protein n=1 Tax=Petroclostridium sp. X23 TaxID=3045146 RepID=UPI0024ADE2E0|nr:hypothetical protein [Petroclostridium sp. X23]WHH60389.1 hypothetical protein QKW49_06600 [Petroclostridium sp. X23]